MSQKWW